MIFERSINVLSSLKIKEKILIFSVLAVLAVYFPTIIHSQPVTGSLVNMSLILAVFFLGPLAAVLLALMPSLFALASGLLPPVLLPMVPFIITGNIILIAVYYYLGRKSFLPAVLAAAATKSLFLFASVNFLISFLPNGEKMLPLAQMMGLAQFLTAVTGGVLAYTVLSFVQKTKK